MRTTEGSSHALKEEDLQQVIAYVRSNSADALQLIALLQVSFRTGLRAMELCGLTLSNLLDRNGVIKDKVTLLKKTTKGSRGGVAYFTNSEVRAALEEYIVQKRSKISTEYDNVFISRKLTPYHPSSMSRLLSQLYRDAGLEGYTSHAGRKGLARVLNANNVSTYNIQHILRHANIETTVNHYLSVDEDVLADIVRSV